MREAATGCAVRPTPGNTGLIRNPLSRRNRNGGARLNGSWAGILQAEPDSPASLTDALREFARREVGLVIVDGGDGTVREVLSALPAAYEAPPILAVLASGTTNLIAADVGAGRADASTVQMLTAIARSGEAKLQRRSTLEITWADPRRRPIHGMFLGSGAFTLATDLSVRLVRQGKIDEGAGVAATLLSAIAQTLLGPERGVWLAGEPMGIVRDGQAVGEHDRFVFLATTLNRLLLGLWPFWGDPGAPGPALRYLDVAARPRRLAAALPAVLRGRPRPWMESAGYRSGWARSLDLVLTRPFVVDGEIFQPGDDGPVRVGVGLEVDFLLP